MPLTLEPEGDHDKVRAEEHDSEDTQDIALGDPAETEDSPGGDEKEDDDDE